MSLSHRETLVMKLMTTDRFARTLAGHRRYSPRENINIFKYIFICVWLCFKCFLYSYFIIKDETIAKVVVPGAHSTITC